MAEFKSIFCPKKKDHKFDKHLLFVKDEELYVYCNQHCWIKVIFKKGGERISFKNSAVILEPMGENFHFEHEPVPVVALGKFHVKQKIKEKYNANKSE